MKDETPFRYAHAEIQIQVIVICDSTRYQLDQGGTFIIQKSSTLLISDLVNINIFSLRCTIEWLWKAIQCDHISIVLIYQVRKHIFYVTLYDIIRRYSVTYNCYEEPVTITQNIELKSKYAKQAFLTVYMNTIQVHQV